MALPWFQILDAALGVTDVARRPHGRPRRRRRRAASPAREQREPGPLEARLAGVVVAALKEAFDRDHQRLELEREQMREQNAARRAARCGSS